MRISILLPHFRTGKMTAYAISQLLKHKGSHEIEIFVINNNSGDGSEEYLKPFWNDIKYFEYPKEKLQSHGIAFDYVVPHITTDFFITIESDSFPTKDNWLDYYEHLINEGIECAGSILKLSGGQYLHPCGSMYSKKNWEEYKLYCDNIEYSYFPNASRKGSFDCHLMVKSSFVDTFLESPESFIEVAEGYKNYTKFDWFQRHTYYSPVVSPFHNGMGMLDESLETYGLRSFASEVPNIILDNKKALINRIGYEPGQAFSYWHMATNKKVFAIPTQIKWMNNRGGQQQEYTLMENGFKHLWGSSAYYDYTPENEKDIAELKQRIPNELYDSLPEHQKIKF